MNKKRLMGVLRVLVLFIGGLVALSVSAGSQMMRKGPVSAFYVSRSMQAKNFVYAGADVTAMPLPLSGKHPVMNPALLAKYPGSPGSSGGFSGTGKGRPSSLMGVAISEPPPPGSAVISLEFGTSSQPFNTHRVDTRAVWNNVSRHRPYRAVGQLYFKIGKGNFLCTGALIKRGLIVTAAHCVAEFGASSYYSDWQFVPAAYDGQAPFGVWTIRAAYVVNSYLDGTDACATEGITCVNDVAVLAVAPKSRAYPGDGTGWLRYGWNGKGFTGNGLALVSQLGYPVSHDKGLKMQQTDSQAFVDADLSNNTVLGGRQTGGSSGGPLVVNLGPIAKLSDGVDVGDEAIRNMVVGVVSWGHVDKSIKQQGASPFTTENIVRLVREACKDFPAACSAAP